VEDTVLRTVERLSVGFVLVVVLNVDVGVTVVVRNAVVGKVDPAVTVVFGVDGVDPAVVEPGVDGVVGSVENFVDETVFFGVVPSGRVVVPTVTFPVEAYIGIVVTPLKTLINLVLVGVKVKRVVVNASGIRERRDRCYCAPSGRRTYLIG
jgi:hypothetical protein